MKRCTKCILPENYPGITFNEEGICNHCITYREREYLGGKALKERIESFLKDKRERNQNYDCVLGLSGGRDSSYLLYYLAKVLNLRVLAYSIDNGFIPEQTRLNLKNMTDILKVKLVIEENDRLEKCLKRHVLSWMHKPAPAMIGVLCTGCKLGIVLGLPNCARKNKIPVIIVGGTPFEGQGYKTSIMKTNPNSKKKSSFILGYLPHLIRNPKWILNRTCLTMQIKEYYHNYYRTIYRQSDLLVIPPYATYIQWEESEIISKIKKELGWKKNPDTESTWRGDCAVALLKLYLYKKILGFNDKDDGLSSLIRDGQISREEALERLSQEGEIPEEAIKEIFDKLGLNYSDLKLALSKCEKISRC